MLRVCVFITFVCVSARTLSGRGFFCRDPDTGMLHPINSTWSAQRFCGNYHCKMRRKNLTYSQYGPYRTINVSKVHLGQNSIDPQTILSRKSYQPNTGTNSEINYNENDRYLTESEIKSIAELLHKVKKSDLDAIVELYDFAQDYYQHRNNNNETATKVEADILLGVKPVNKKSYWYDPFSVKVIKTVDDADEKLIDIINIKKSKSAYPYNTYSTYYTGPLHSKDFRRIPPFYPISNFQRLYSYVREQSYKQPQWSMATALPKQKIYHNTVHRSFLLPFPFSHIPRHNISNQHLSKRIYDHGKIIHTLDHDHKIDKGSQMAILVNPYLEHSQGGVGIKPSKENDENHRRPSWITDDLPADVLKEVRANVNEKRIILSLPFRKKITLDKVDKVRYEDKSRPKRENKVKRNNISSNNSSKDVLETELYEVYIEKITCKPDYSVPGYFRRGNMSLGYPRCCPQRIDN